MVETYEAEKTKGYPESVLNRLHKWGAITVGNDDEQWANHWGMTVRQLVTRLAHLDPDMPVVIRAGVGWDGVANYGIGGIDEGIILKSMDDDYPTQREEMRKGELETMTVVVLTKEGYEPDTVREWD